MKKSVQCVSLAPIAPPFWEGTKESSGWVKLLPKLPVIKDRQAFLGSWCQGRTLIHVGFGDAGARDATESEGRWVHGVITRDAKRVIGLDLDPDAVAQARQEGQEAFQVDCTDPTALAELRLPEVDLILLGEVIEHVGNPGDLLQAMRSIAGPRTDLLVTTPNAYRLTTIINVATRRETGHPDHVAIWSLPLLAQLVARSGWEPTAAAMYQVPVIRGESARRSSGMRAIAGNTIRRTSDALVRSATPFWADGLILSAKPRQ